MPRLCFPSPRRLPVRQCDLLPVPRSAAAMDKILEAVVMSSYPASVKQGLVRRVLEAARQPLDREQCLALLALGARLYVDGADELPRRVGCQLLHVAGRHHPEVFAEFFSAGRVLRLLQGGAGPPGPRALACVQLGLQLLPEGPAAEEVCALLRREVLRTVCERPGPAACAQVARLLARHPRCLPDGPHRLLFCQQLVRCLGRFRCPAEGEEGAVEFLEQAQQVSGLLAQLWRAQPAAILPCLKELFAVISGTGGCALTGWLGLGQEGARVCQGAECVPVRARSSAWGARVRCGMCVPRADAQVGERCSRLEFARLFAYSEHLLGCLSCGACWRAGSRLPGVGKGRSQINLAGRRASGLSETIGRRT